MLRRSLSTIAVAVALFTLGLFLAGSPLATAITLGSLIFVAIIIVMVSWQDLKKSIVEEQEIAGRLQSEVDRNEAPRFVSASD